MHLVTICTMSSNFDWEVRRSGMRDTLKHGTITASGFGYFHKNCRFLWEKNVSKTNLGSTIHYTYMSYNKYFRLCVISLCDLQYRLMRRYVLRQVVQIIETIYSSVKMILFRCFSFLFTCTYCRNSCRLLQTYFVGVNALH